MSDCCSIDLGSFPHNADVDTELVAAATGTYKVMLNYLGSVIPINVSVIQGNTIVIPNDRLNENYTYEMTIEDPNGDLIESAYCTGFKFKTYVSLDSDCDSVCDNVYS